MFASFQRFLRCAFAVALSFAAVVGAGGAPIVLELKSRADVSGTDVHLGDVATARSDVPEGFLDCPVGSAPSLGRERTWTREAVAAVLKGRFEGSELRWEGSPSCRVQSPARPCTVGELRETIVRELRRMAGENGSIELLEFAGFEPFLIPTGTTETRVEMAPSTNTSPWSSATVRFLVRGDTALTRSIRFHWAWNRPVWVVSQPAAAGDGLDPKDFQQATMDVLRLTPDVYLGGELPRDSRLTQALAPGTVLCSRHLRALTLVKRGAPVMVHYVDPRLVITMKAMALEDGARNAIIQVQNPSSRKQLAARVMDEENVEVVR